MVSVFQVWLADENRTVWLYVSDEGFTLTSVDWLNCEIDYDDKMVVETVNISDLPSKDSDYYELYRECLFEYVKKDCLHSDPTEICISLLPAELYNTMSVGYLQWLHEDERDSVLTDGYKIIEDVYYCPGDPDIIACKKLLDYMHKEMAKMDGSEAEIDAFYSLPISITVGDQKFDTAMSAAMFSGLEDCLKYFIDQY